VGDNVDAAAKPIISVTVTVTRFNSTDDHGNNVSTPVTQATVTKEVVCLLLIITTPTSTVF